ncbi:trypsin delta-like [Neocloeon triangulifer]|uniref:trypsin delta-like n=1 Tax=Neocloeon triangulifer TaxID=2078957 RepID=UPI00286F5D4E|nr:trypsin delta-like [Neocloeon triangulifer]
MKSLLVSALLLALLVQAFAAPPKPKAKSKTGSKQTNVINKQVYGASGSVSVSVLGQFKHHVSVVYDASKFCGGSIISPNKILTAAHCVQSNSIFQLGTILVCAARLTVTSLFTAEAGAFCSLTTSKIIHPKYNKTNLDFDIAIVTLTAGDLTFSSTIGAIRLPSFTDVNNAYVGASAVVAGWGWFSATGYVSTQLQYANFSIATNSNCSVYYSNSNNVTVNNSTTCIIPSGGAVMCTADAGGAVLIKEADGLSTIFAVATQTSASCNVTTPQVSYRVGAYAALDWIHNVTLIARRT